MMMMMMMLLMMHLYSALSMWIYSNVLYNIVCGSDADTMGGHWQGSLRPRLSESTVRRDPPVYGRYLRAVQSLTICRYQSGSSAYTFVILRP